MNTRAIKQLLEAMEQGGYQYLDLQLGQDRIKLVRGKEPTAVAGETAGTTGETGLGTGTAAAVAKPLVVLSERVGVFSAGKAPVQKGAEVKKGQTLGIIKGISIQDNVIAPLTGTVKEVFVKEGDLVEFGRRLFSIEPE